MLTTPTIPSSRATSLPYFMQVKIEKCWMRLDLLWMYLFQVNQASATVIDSNNHNKSAELYLFKGVLWVQITDIVKKLFLSYKNVMLN